MKYKPWKDRPKNVCSNPEPDNNAYISEWHNFLETPYAKLHVPNWSETFQHVLENIDQPEEEFVQNVDVNQEEWMILSDYHNSSINFTVKEIDSNAYDWHLDSLKYSPHPITEMPNWIKTEKDNYSTPTISANMQPVGTHSFSDRQRLAYDIIINHANIDSNKESLLMIINGEGGTGKSYLISAIHSSLKGKCTITATIGKASYSVSGITIHSFFSLPVTSNSHKDLSGQALVNLQKKLTTVEYIFTDEYSMLGQVTLGWIDRRCRQATGQNHS